MDEQIMTNAEFLSACVMKHLWRGELERAKFYLERLIELQMARGGDGPPP